LSETASNSTHKETCCTAHYLRDALTMENMLDVFRALEVALYPPPKKTD
jgi:hypothetical protein